MLSLFRRSAVTEVGNEAGQCTKRRRLFVLKSSTRGVGVRGGVLEAEALPEPKLKVSKVAGDGRCMFRSIARGLAMLSREELPEELERENADKLRLTACELIMVDKREWFEETGLLEESVDEYCKRMRSPDFYGGEPELYLLSDALRKSVLVYLQGDSPDEHKKLLEYGPHYSQGQNDKIRLLYNGRNHYDFLEPIDD